MESTLKEQFKQSMQKFNKGLALVKEESDIANRGEFCAKIDIEYLAQGYALLAEFKDEVEKMLKKC